MNQISLVLIEDHKMVRQMWIMLFEAKPEVQIVGESGTFIDAVDTIVTHKPDIILLDINLPDISGIDAVPKILAISPGTRIIAVSMHNQLAYSRRMFELGAKGYVTKNSSPDEIFVAIDAILKGDTYLCEEMRMLLSDKAVDK